MSYEDLPERWRVEIKKYLKDRGDSESLCTYHFNRNVIVNFEDGSYLNFRKCLILNHKDEIAIFTEHNGYHLFYESSIKSLDSTTW